MQNKMLYTKILTVKLPADTMSDTRQFKMAYTREVMNTRAASSSLQL